MKIVSAQVELASGHVRVEKRETKESLIRGMASGSGAPRIFNGANTLKPAESAQLNLSEAGQKARKPDVARTLENLDVRIDDNPRLAVIRALIEILTGRKVRVLNTLLEDPADAPPGLIYERHESYFEAETTHFSAQGKIRAADGREFDFTLDLAMSRRYYEENNVSIQMGAAQKDPLVLNFSGAAAELSEMRIQFDLDADEKMDSIAALKPGSAFLVFDRNQDGRVNDGSELFGALTGDGFGELAAMDEDGNGWIDENDRIYARLYLWENGVGGTEQLKGLEEAGVGAISLTYVDTPFSLRGQHNEALGEIRSTGIFLMENGNVGTLQKIDLTV
ncbi:MAG: VCBS repeat-containing protein [Candidatus Accumulibacter sp.]|jgi:hypothetical protein|nr:VCBS repeat-containing protein [Accumulibacter sp.]